jgi:protoporphyrin/coproporphyrin ferrochelatase
MRSYDAVLFIGFGGPEKQEDVMPFLEGIYARLPAGRQGRGIPKERLQEVAHHYEVIGGKSPINEITRRQANALEQELRTQGSGLRVYVGQRNWHPFLEDTLRKMADDGIKQAIGFPAAAHRCEASLERYVNATEEARRQLGDSAPVIHYIGPWFDHPLFVDAIVQRVQEALKTVPPDHQARMKWFFTAHSIPDNMAKESTYVQDLRRTAELVCDKFGRKQWALAYSSRSGNPRDLWLEPDVCDLIRSEASQGIKYILFIPIGFIADHVEILFDLDIEAQAAAREAGVTLYRSQSVGDHPLFTRMMADVVRARMNQ